jgi:PAS domain S-box-containing protein
MEPRKPGAPGWLRPSRALLSGSGNADQSELQFSLLARPIDLLIWEADPERSQFRSISAGNERFLGYTLAEWQELGFWQSIVHPEDWPDVSQLAAQNSLHSQDLQLGYRAIRADGQLTWLQDTVHWERDAAGRVVLAQGLMIETSRLASEESCLRRSNSYYCTLMMNSGHGIFRARLDGTIVDANPALARILGFGSPEELIGRSIVSFYANPTDRERLVSKIQTEVGYQAVEVEWRRCDGLPLVVSLTGTGVRGADGQIEATEAIVEDITDRRILQQQLREAQKLEAIGRLAGGIAHDFNNLLTVVSGYAALLQEQLVEREPGSKYLDGLIRATERAEMLTQQLLAFGRRQVLQPRVLRINGVIADLDRMLRRLIGENIEMVTLLDPAVAPVLVDPSRLSQVVMNLVLNARDAMADGGRVTIETRNLELTEQDRVLWPDAMPGRYVLLSVTDTGIGMDQETLAHLFEPFYSTKQPGKGSGLGLATVYGVVRQSGGYVRVTSRPGSGTCFDLCFPASSAPIDESESEPETRDRTPGGDETILVVEDEEAVRSLACQVLRTRGYKVLEARHGEEALELAERNPAPIHLLLTDLVMPVLGGRELAAQLISRRRELRVLFVSGYSDQLLFGSEDLGPRASFLQKPFSPERLASRVRECLDRSS